MRAIAVSLIASLALAGCDASGGGAQEETPAEAPAPSEPVAQGKVVLSADGVAAGSESFRFNAGRSEVDSAVAAVLGEPSERSENAECGAGPVQFSTFDGLTLNYQDDRLVGWFAEGSDNIVTVDGIATGVPFTQLQGERQAAMVEDTTLDGEFSYASADGADIGGFVDAQGNVASLNAGVNCFFR